MKRKVFNVLFLSFQTTLSFLVYDRDVNWQAQSDDFMGSCNLQMSLVQNFTSTSPPLYHVICVCSLYSSSTSETTTLCTSTEFLFNVTQVQRCNKSVHLNKDIRTKRDHVSGGTCTVESSWFTYNSSRDFSSSAIAKALKNIATNSFCNF